MRRTLAGEVMLACWYLLHMSPKVFVNFRIPFSERYERFGTIPLAHTNPGGRAGYLREQSARGACPKVPTQAVRWVVSSAHLDCC